MAPLSHCTHLGVFGSITQIVESKLAGSAAERETVRKLRPDGDGTAKPDAPRRRKRKGANPLSCLKKKPKIPSSDVSHAVTGTAPPKKVR